MQPTAYGARDRSDFNGSVCGALGGRRLMGKALGGWGSVGGNLFSIPYVGRDSGTPVVPAPSC
jgi:hypothetical protein